MPHLYLPAVQDFSGTLHAALFGPALLPVGAIRKKPRTNSPLMDATLMNYPVMDRPFDDVSKTPPGDDEAVCSVLAEAIEALRDSEETFRQASEHTSSEPLKNALLDYSGQRALFVRELQSIEREYGKAAVDHTGTMGGAMHRAWVGLKTVLTKRSDRDILEETVGAEEAAADVYTGLIANGRGLPPQVSLCLSRQCAELQKAGNELAAMRDACRS
jgi:uncharacterized protein (TIGR02284 family)